MRQLWIAGATGSGSCTMVQATLAGLASGTNAPVKIVINCEEMVGKHSAAGFFEDELLVQATSQLERLPWPEQERHVEVFARAVLRQCPGVASAVGAAVEAANDNAGYVSRDDRRGPLVERITTTASVVAAWRRQQRLHPAMPLHSAFAVFRGAARSEPAAFGAPASGYLFAALESLAVSVRRDIVLILLRTEAVRKSQTGAELLREAESRTAGAAESAEEGAGVMRLLLQTRDVAAAAAARRQGTSVLIVDGWSESMARAVVEPRYLPPGDNDAWRCIWSMVGGHAGHLRALAEELSEAQRLREQQEMVAEQEKAMRNMERERRPVKSQDAQAKADEAVLQGEEDSKRADYRDRGVVEIVLGKLPELLDEDVRDFERRAEQFLRHPVLHELSEAHGAQLGRFAAEVVAGVRRLCEQPRAVVKAEAAQPLHVALLDAGILVPGGGNGAEADGGSAEELVLANRFTRSLLLAWAEGLCADLPWRQQLECQLVLWQEARR
eukprot:NODE_4387_length_1898_cov_2.622812.p1 GENE.NODE_4387_length_1898_cov_2.622812~~NODE_4387_length_1898_cov_2.622812.p1  ORF type:complete len:551 (-),score=156.15 NODE_4387_length_1898_cov_2.622812:245-1738(-)